jgi:hypothetical protein
MNLLRLSGILFSGLLCLFSPSLCHAQEKTIKATVTDRQNNRFNLTGMTISGVTVVHILLKDSESRVNLEKIRSISVVAEPAVPPPFKGYVLADIILVEGGSSRVWIDFENYWAEGVDETLGITIRIPLTDIARLDLTTAVVPPSPQTQSSTPR